MVYSTFNIPETKDRYPFGTYDLINDMPSIYHDGQLPNLRGGSNGWLLNGGGRAANGVFADNVYTTDSVSGLVANPNWNIIGGGGEAYRDLNFNAYNSNSAYSREDNYVLARWVKLIFCIKY